jgi:multifunctional beta-oxidation protein
MSLRFEGQTVVVIGAGRGLGSLFATQFAARGAQVVVHDQNDEVRIKALLGI